MSIIHIPFYPSDWLGGTRKLSDAETGVYITLICHMYEMAGPIERDDDRLSRYCGCRSKAGFVKILGHLIQEGKITEQKEGLFNDKVGKIIKNVVEKSSAARESAQRRWDKKPKENKGAGNANASEPHMPKECYPKPELYKEAKASYVISDAITFFNSIAGDCGWPSVKKMSTARKSALKIRIKDIGGYDNWKEAIIKASNSPHLIGNNNRGWNADFDWLHKDANFTKLIEGNYDTKGKSNGQQKANINDIGDWAERAASIDLTPPPDGT